MQLVTALRDALANAIDDDLGATSYARFYTAIPGTLLASCALATPDPFGASSSGTITLTGTPQDTSPAAAGTATRLTFYLNNTAASGAWRMQMGIATSGTPDVTMANNVIATTDTVQITSLTITVPAGTPTV